MKLHAKFEPRRQVEVRRSTPLTAPRSDERPSVPAPPPPPAPKLPPSRAARNLALAHHLGRLIDRGLIADQTAAARMLGVSQVRVTHLLSLRLLAPQIQEAILDGQAVGDKQLRRCARLLRWSDQLAAIKPGRG